LLFTRRISLVFTAQSGGTAPTKLNLANQTKLKQQSQVRQSQGSLKYLQIFGFSPKLSLFEKLLKVTINTNKPDP
jgi:hypothetical protein